MGKFIKKIIVFTLCIALMFTNNAISAWSVETIAVGDGNSNEETIISDDVKEDETSVIPEPENELEKADDENEDKTENDSIENDSIEDSGIEDDIAEEGDDLQSEEELESVDVDDEEVIASEEGDSVSKLSSSETMFEYAVLSDETAQITGLKEGYTPESLLEIPNSIDGHTVTSIGPEAFEFVFKNGEEIELVLPNTLKEICGRYSDYYLNGAFRGCEGLVGQLVIPKSVETIGPYAFSGCKNLESLTFEAGSNLKKISEYAFADCSRLDGVLNLPESLEYISDYCFMGCSGFDGMLVIPKNVLSIGVWAFYQCSGFTALNFANDSKLERIHGYKIGYGGGAFAECTGLSGKITIPESLKYLGWGIFYGCKNIEEVYLPSNWDGGDSKPQLFSGCTSLKRVINKSDQNVVLPAIDGCSWENLQTGETITEIKNGIAVRSDYIPNSFEFWSNLKDKNDSEKKVKLKYHYNYSDDWFLEDRTEIYNHDIAKASLCVAVAAFDCPDSNIHPDSSNIENLMDDIGFADKQIDYYPPKKENSIGTIIGKKDISDDTSLILLAVRGGGYRDEWGSNFNVYNLSSTVEHAGFNEASNLALGRLDNYIGNHKSELKENVKIWVCGFSRAAATSNLVSARLIDGQYTNGNTYSNIDSLNITSQDVYGYCFECPQNTVNFHANDDQYKYIVSVVNPVDFVPMVAMNNNLDWRYRRYGTTYSTPSKLTKWNNYSSYKSKMEKEFSSIVSSNENAESISAPSQICGEELLIKELVRWLAAETENPIEYSHLYQEQFVTAMAKYLGKGDYRFSTKEFFFLIADVLKLGYGVFDNILVPFSFGLAVVPIWEDYSANIFAFHYQELCFAWLNSMTKTEAKNAITDKNYTKYLAFPLDIFNQLDAILPFWESPDGNGTNPLPDNNQPTDYVIEIRDSNGNLVGKVVNGEIQNLSDGVYIYYNLSGQLAVAMAGDEQFTISLVADDDINLCYSMEEINAGTGDIERSVIYSDVEVGGDEEVIINSGAVDGEQETDYSLKVGEENISPQSDCSGSEIVFCNVSASVETDGAGYVFGKGTYEKGRIASLEAVPEKGYLFDSWYKGEEKISEDAAISFEVNDDIELVAKFAVDENATKAPEVESVSFSDDSEYPDINVKMRYYNEVSLFTMSIDDVEVVDTESYSTLLDDDGVITYQVESGLSIGEHALKIYAEDVKGNKMPAPYTETFTVVKKTAVTGVGFAKKNMILEPGDNETLEVNVYPSDATDTSVIFESSDSEMVSVDGDGKITAIKEGKAEITVITTDGEYSDKCEVTVKKSDVEVDDVPEGGEIPEGMWIAVIKNPDTEDGKFYYTGKAIKPSVRVYDNTTLLTAGKDYSVSYSNNTKAGEHALITISGKGNYSGKEKTEFVISPADISGSEYYAEDIMVKYAAGKIITPKVALLKDGKALSAKNDFGYTIYAKADTEKNNPLGTTVTESGDYTILISGKGNYTGERSISFAVTENLKSVSGLKIGKIAAVNYTGEAIEPKPVISDGKTPLHESTTDVEGEYTLSYSNNTNVGTGYIVIKGNPDKGYTGTKRISFKINGRAIKSPIVTGIPASVVYTGTEITFDDMVVAMDKGSTVLNKENDYDILYTKNQNVGKATIEFRGKNGYTGSVKKTFTIKAYPLTDEKITVDSSAEGVYSKAGAKNTVKVTFDGTVLKEGTDYTLSYANNKKTDVTAKVTIKGKGNFTGSIVKEFTVAKADIGTSLVTAEDKVYQEKANIFATKITVYDNGKALKAGTDYDKNIEYRYLNRTRVVRNGVGTTVAAGSVVDAKDIIPADTVIKVKVTGKGYYEGNQTGTYRIMKNSISKAKVTVKGQTYTGAPILLTADDIMVKVGDELKLYDKSTGEGDFVITDYEKNVNKGTATAKIKGIGNYGGEKKITFKIGAKGFLWWFRGLL